MTDSLPGARTAILARLWGAVAREPLPGIADRRRDGDQLIVTSSAGRTARGPAAAAEPFARPDRLTITVDGVPHDDPGPLLTALIDAPGLRTEIDNSVTNLALARTATTIAPRPLPHLYGRPDALAYLEQSVVDGHPLHPLCRTRTGMTERDIRRYAPEFRPVVELPVLAVPADRWTTTGAGLPPLLPMHPWQYEHVRAAYPFLIDTGERRPARPLMSLRTLALVDEPGWHLKTAVDIQMTSAVRIVSPAAIHNGPIVSRLLERLLVALGDDRHLDVLVETAAGAVLVDGEPARHLAVVRRRAPRIGPDELAVPFGVLSATSPATGRAFVREVVDADERADPVAWFTALIDVAVPVVLRLLHHGVALEAHGQNLLVVLRDNRPVRLAYRDMGGVRISPARLGDTPDLRGDLVTDDPDELRTKVAAAFWSTVVAELVATFGREYGEPPTVLWRIAAAAVRQAYRELPSSARGDERALLAAPLPIKATTAMRLAARPLEDIWTPIDNPMAAL